MKVVVVSLDWFDLSKQTLLRMNGWWWYSLARRSEEKSQDFASGVLSLGLLVINDAVWCRKHNESELTRWKKVLCPCLHVSDGQIKTRTDDTTLIKTSVQINNDFASAVVVDNFKFADVAVLHHDGEKFDDNFRARSQHDLSLVSLLSVADCLQGIGQWIHTHHFWIVWSPML